MNGQTLPKTRSKLFPLTLNPVRIGEEKRCHDVINLPTARGAEHGGEAPRNRFTAFEIQEQKV